jgi:hypothetical protein
MTAKTTKPAAKRKPAATKAAARKPAKAKVATKAKVPTKATVDTAEAPSAPTVTAPLDAAAPAPPGEHSDSPDYVRLPRPEPGDTTISYVRRHMPFVLAAFVSGHSLATIGESFDPPLSGLQLRIAITGDVEIYKQFQAAKDQRAHFLVEEATEAALKCGIPKERAETILKVVERTAPHLYGAKSTVALTGAEGGPIASTVEMSPTEAYLRMMKGG